jgi:ATPase subunit of ABC transporter with duplicated ATPase domains
MARSALLQLTGVSLTFGGDPIFDDLGLVVQEGDRAALVSRNGSGKSTLMKVMAGLVLPDQGARSVPGGNSRVGDGHQLTARSTYRGSRLACRAKTSISSHLAASTSDFGATQLPPAHTTFGRLR